MQNKEELLKKLNKIKPVVVLLIMPSLMALLLCYAFGAAYIKDVPVIVYDRDNSEISRQVAEELGSSQGLSIDGYVYSMEEVKEKILSEEAVAAIIFPERFAKDMRSGNGASMRIIISGTNLFLGNNCMLSAATVINSMNIGLKTEIMEAAGIVPADAQNYSTTLMFAENIMYNPEMSYMQYLIIGVMAVLVQQVYFLFTGILFIDNRLEKRLLRDVGTKVCLYALLSVSGFLMSLIVLRICVGFKMIGNIFIIILLQLLFIAALTGSALFFSSLFERKESFAQLSLFLALPTFITSTFVWPSYMMPKGMITVVKALWPLGDFAPQVKGVLQKGMGFTEIYNSVIYLIIFAVIWGAAGYVVYKKRLFGKV